MTLQLQSGEKTFLVCEGCKEVSELRNLGIAIYRYNVKLGHVEGDETSGNWAVTNESNKDIFIVLNTRDVTVPASYEVPEKSPLKITCKRCQYITTRAKNYLERNRHIDKQDISGICDHCRMKQMSRNVQTICDEIITKYFLNQSSGRGVDSDHKTWITPTCGRPYSDSELRTTMQNQLISKQIGEDKEKRRAPTRYHSQDSYITAFPRLSEIDHYPPNKYVFPKDSKTKQKPLQADISSAELISEIREKQRIQAEDLEKKAARQMELSDEDIIGTDKKNIIKPKKKESIHNIYDQKNLKQKKVKESDKGKTEKADSKDQIGQKSKLEKESKVAKKDSKDNLIKEKAKTVKPLLPLPPLQPKDDDKAKQATKVSSLKLPPKPDNVKLPTADDKKKDIQQGQQAIKEKEKSTKVPVLKLPPKPEPVKQPIADDKKKEKKDTQQDQQAIKDKEKSTKVPELKLPPKPEPVKQPIADDKKKEKKDTQQDQQAIKDKEKSTKVPELKLPPKPEPVKQPIADDKKKEKKDKQQDQQAIKEKSTKVSVLKLPPKPEPVKLPTADDKKKEKKDIQQNQQDIKEKEKSTKVPVLKLPPKPEPVKLPIADDKKKEKKETAADEIKGIQTSKKLNTKEKGGSKKEETPAKPTPSQPAKEVKQTIPNKEEIKQSDEMAKALAKAKEEREREKAKEKALKKEPSKKNLNLTEIRMISDRNPPLNFALTKTNASAVPCLPELPHLPHKYTLLTILAESVEDLNVFGKKTQYSENKLEMYDRTLLEEVLKHGTDKAKLKQLTHMIVNSDLALDIESFLNERPPVRKRNMIKGNNIVRLDPLALTEKKPNANTPLLFEKEVTKFPAIEHIERRPSADLSEKATEIDMDDTKRQMVRFTLSDRSFIDKGWTMLPTEKVLRRMNIYRMRPSHPEFDWFKRNKNKGYMTYDTGEKLAEFEQNGRGRCYYKNGRLALNYYDAEELNAKQRYVVYSSGEPDKNGRPHPVTVLAMFDYSGNGIVFDHNGKIRLKYNQTEGVVLDRSLGPATHWKWHSLNDPPVLQKVMIDTHMTFKDPRILNLLTPGEINHKEKPYSDQKEMLNIEFENFIKEKAKKLTATFHPYQIKMKALEINGQFSLRILDQATIYLHFHDGPTHMKLNLGMNLDHQEIVDTEVVELGDVANSLEHFPARTESLENLQKGLEHAHRAERLRVERIKRLTHPVSRTTESADKLEAALSRPPRTAAGKIASRFSYTCAV